MPTLRPLIGHLSKQLMFGLLSLTCTALTAEPPAQEPALARTFMDTDLQWGPCPDFIPAGCEIAVLHGDPTRENADIFFKVPGGHFTVPHHRHTSAERMVLVTGEMQVRYDGQDAVVLRPGTYAYGPARLPHTAVCKGSEPCVLFIAFEEPVDAFAVTPD